MKELKLIFLLLVLSMAAKTQTENFAIKDSSTPFRATEVKAESFKMKKVATAYDLALNLSYCHHISNSFNGEYLILPIITINGKPVEEKLLKQINLPDILDYQFDSGIKTSALYGARGKYGHLILHLKDEKTNN
jgi:hypothetical protein